MRSLIFLIRRNLALFLRNKLNILLSFVSILIIISLYVLFLRDFLVQLVSQTGLEPSIVEEFTDRLMYAGLLVVINTTTCFGIIQICVNDCAIGIRRDYMTAPISSFTLTIGYFVSSIIISLLFTLLSTMGGELYFHLVYGNLLPVTSYIKSTAFIIAASCINSGILLCFANELKNTTTFSTFANLYGTVIGFLAGAYLPYYFYPEWLKPILFYFPPTQLTSLIRREYLTALQATLDNGSAPQMASALYENFGITLYIHNKTVTTYEQLSILLLSMALLLLLLRIRQYKTR